MAETLAFGEQDDLTKKICVTIAEKGHLDEKMLSNIQLCARSFAGKQSDIFIDLCTLLQQQKSKKKFVKCKIFFADLN